MSKRNAQALAAMMRKAGPHGGSRRPQSSRDGDWAEEFDECLECEGSGIDFDADPDTHLDGSCNECGGTGVACV